MKIEQTFRRYLFIFIFIGIAVLPISTQAEQNTENTPSHRGKAPSPEPTQLNFLNIGTYGVFIPRFRPDLLNGPSYYGIEFGYIYETHKYAITTELHLINSPSAFISIGGCYFFGQQNISTYVGGGCAIGALFLTYSDPVEGYGFAFTVPMLDVYASTGIEMFRWTNSRLKLEARTTILLPVYTIGLSFAYNIGN